MTAALTVIVPELDFKVTARKLEIIDLELQILKADELLTLRQGPWFPDYGGTLAAYGLILLRELQGRGLTLKNPELIKRVTRCVSGAHDELPPWLPDYMQNHRSYVSCLGWVQYLRKRGLSETILLRYKNRGFMEMISESGDLPKLFEELEDWCNRAKFGKGKKGFVRAYSDYDPPALRALCP